MSETGWLPTDQEEQEEHPKHSIWNFFRRLLIILIILAVIYTLVNTFGFSLPVQADLSTPSGTAEEFIHRLVSHDFVRAGQQLSDSLSQQVSSDDLHVLVRHIEIEHLRIADVHANTITIQGDNAVAAVHLVSARGTRQAIQIPLHREHGEWRIASIDPIWELIKQITHPDEVQF